MKLTKEEGQILIRIARRAINQILKPHDVEKMHVYDFLEEKRGVFVTLYKKGKLRGCIGYPQPVMKLGDAIIDAAKAAAFEDPRFKPVILDELDDIELEISVLTVPELIEVSDSDEYLSLIHIGEDGLIIRGDYGSGLLLPQVFVKYGCNVNDALEMLCQKAGLSPGDWKDLSNKVYKFQAQVFEE